MYYLTTTPDPHYSKKAANTKSGLYWAALQAKQRCGKGYATPAEFIENVITPAYNFAGFVREDPAATKSRWFLEFLECGTVKEI